MSEQLPQGDVHFLHFRIRRRIALTAFLVFVIDDVSKYLAFHFLGDNPKHLVGSLLQLHLLLNSGAAFSLGRNMGPLYGLAAVAICLCIIFYGNKIHRLKLSVPLGFILGGALGNLADRIFHSPAGITSTSFPGGGFFHGAVIDWIELPHWPVFNAADSFLTIGIGWLILVVIYPNVFDK
jgi:signal peptidase II